MAAAVAEEFGEPFEGLSLPESEPHPQYTPVEKNPVMVLNEQRKGCVYTLLGETKMAEYRFEMAVTVDGRQFTAKGA